MNTKEEILHFLRENKNELLSTYHLSKIGLYNIEDVYSLKTALKAYLSEQFNRSVDLAREKYLKPFAKAHILKDTIYV